MITDTKQTEALKLALECIEAWDRGGNASDYWRDRFDAITAIREALADHSTNRPISRLDAYPKEQVAAAKEDVLSAVEHHGLSEQPAQQPHCNDCGGFDPECPLEKPASKPWVGLTNQELIDLTAIYSGIPLYCAIEAKLKEKNA